MIQLQKLTKSFGDHLVLDKIDLQVQKGECLALIGPNGAGKTTLLRILATLTRPDEGQILISGMDLADRATEIRRQIGFLSHQPLLYDDLSADENLLFYGRMYDVMDVKTRIAALLQQVALEPNQHGLVRTFSRGMRQRLSIARALLHDPPILLMDEPYTGLDQQAASVLDRVLQDVGVADRTIILTTHDLDRGWRVSDRVAMLVGGRIAYETRVRSSEGDPELGLDRLRQEYFRHTAWAA